MFLEFGVDVEIQAAVFVVVSPELNEESPKADVSDREIQEDRLIFKSLSFFGGNSEKIRGASSRN